MIHDDLLAQARRLARGYGGAPATEADLRRAISACYYAAFHALTFWAAVTLLGEGTGDNRRRSLLRRAATHAGARSALLSLLGGTLPKVYEGTVDAVVTQYSVLATRFTALQDARHLADYDFAAAVTEEHADGPLQDAREFLAILASEAFRTLPDFRLICALVFVHERLRSR